MMDITGNKELAAIFKDRLEANDRLLGECMYLVETGKIYKKNLPQAINDIVGILEGMSPLIDLINLYAEKAKALSEVKKKYNQQLQLSFKE